MRLALFAGAVLALTAWAPTTAHAVSFTAPTNYLVPPTNVPHGPQDVAAGDFNGDSDPDLAVAHQDANKISVLLGSAAGSFTAPTDFGLFSGANPLSVAVGEFNGDSDPDLAVANEGSLDGTVPGGVSVLLGAAGGSFTGPANLATGTNPQEVAVGEFNGDSDPDLAVANLGSNDVSVLLGAAGGSFTGPTNFVVGSGPIAVAAGQFNDDSDADLAVANDLSDNVSILLGGAGGSFGAPTNFGVGSAPISIATGQFNGDSDPDLAVANELTNDVSTLLGGAGGSFSGSSSFAVGNLPDAVAVGQFNGDSDPDIAVANQASDNVSLLFGGTGASFTGPNNFTAGDGPSSVAVSDFNGDSHPDLAVTNEISNNVAILLATPPETTIDSGPPGVTNDSTPTFSFSSNDPSSTFQCRVNGGGFSSCTSPHTLAAALPDGTHTFEVRATDDAQRPDPTPASWSFTVDTAPPSLPGLTDTEPLSPANQNNPRVKGTAAPNTTVKLYTTSDCSGGPAATGPAAAFGSPGIQVSLPDDSTTTFHATASDQAGNASPCSTSSVTYVEDSTAPDPPNLSDTEPASPANHNSPRVKGTAAPSTTVTLYTTSDCSGGPAAIGPAATFGSPGIQVSLPDDSTTTFHATASDQAGNASPCSPSSLTYVEDSTAPDPPNLSDTEPASPANHNSPRVKGTAAANTTVRLYKAATTADCTPANLVAIDSAAALASPGLQATVGDDSTITFRATATDAAGNASPCSTSSLTYVEDSTAPDPPNLSDTEPASPANHNSPRVKGTAAPSTTVTLYTTSDCSGGSAATGSAGDFLSPGLTVSVPDNSTTSLYATATDAAGNTSACSTSSVGYVEDSTVPDAPNLTDTEPLSPANHNSPRVKGTAAPSTTVRLYKATTSADCTPANLVATDTAAAFASPGFQVTVPDDSTTTFRATATDQVGNTSNCSTSSIGYVEDSTAPDPPTLRETEPLSPANHNSPRVKGTAAPSTTVRLYKATTSADCTPANLVATDTAAAFASPGLQVTVGDDSTTSFRATASDAAGNTSACSTSSITYEELSPPLAPPPLGEIPGPPAGGAPPASGGVPLGGAGTRDTSGPRMAIRGKALKLDSRGVVVVPLSCPVSEPGGCEGVLSLETLGAVRVRTVAGGRTRSRRQKVKLGRRAFRLAGGRNAVVKLPLSRRNQVLVRTLANLRVLAIVAARDKVGNERTTRKPLSLKAAKLNRKR